MSDEPLNSNIENEPDFTDEDLEGDELEYEDDTDYIDTEPSLTMIGDTMDTFLAAASVDAVYGDPVEVGDNLLIPTAEVLAVMGFGVGSGYGSDPDEEKGTTSQGGGGGGGGGGRVLSRPVAVLISSPEGVRVEPVVDVTKIALAALTAAGFIFGMMMRMLRGPRDD